MAHIRLAWLGESKYMLGMWNEDPIRVQILATRDDAGDTARAVTAARDHMPDIIDIARGVGAEAMLVCPAPDGFVTDGFDLVVAARFNQSLDEDMVFARQDDLARELHHTLKVNAVVLDLDGQLGPFLQHIGPMLAAPYRDDIGRGNSYVRPDA